MKLLFKVKYDEANQRQGVKHRWWDEDNGDSNIVASDAEQAIRKLRKWRVGTKWTWENDKGATIHERVVAVRIFSVLPIDSAEIDVA